MPADVAAELAEPEHRQRRRADPVDVVVAVDDDARAGVDRAPERGHGREIAASDDELCRLPRDRPAGVEPEEAGNLRRVVLAVTFRLPAQAEPVRYAALAGHLGVEVGAAVPTGEVRAAVLDLRRAKGMVLDPGDHDTWSAGSFFTNPVLDPNDADDAARLALLPAGAPRWPAVRTSGKSSRASGNSTAPKSSGSACWAPSRICIRGSSASPWTMPPSTQLRSGSGLTGTGPWRSEAVTARGSVRRCWRDCVPDR